MQGSHDVILSHLRDQPWTKLVEKFNKYQTRKHNRPDIYFAEDEFNKYSVQPRWKELILQKEQELSISREDTAPTRPPPAAVRKDPAPTRPPPAAVRKDPAPTRPPPAAVRKDPAPTRPPTAAVRKDPAPTRPPPAAVRKDPAPTRPPPAVVRKDPAPTRPPPAAVRKDPAPTRPPPAAVRKDPAPTRPPTAAVRKDPAPTRPPPAAVRKDPAPTRPPPAAVRKDLAPTRPPPAAVRNQVDAQPGKGRSCSVQLVVPPVAATQQHKTQGRLAYPRPSWLTMAEQKQYLDLYDKYMSYIPAKASAMEVKEIHQLKELQLRVAAEQNEFMAFLETSARTFPEDYAFIHSESSKYIEEHLAWKRTRVSNYPRYYTILDSVSLAPPRSITEHVCFCHMKTLLRLGTVPKVILPNIRSDNRPHVPVNYAKVNCNFPATPVNDKRKKVCSGDETTERLAEKYKVDVVISASGFKCLMDNSAPVYHQAWELPIVVREYAIEGGSRRIVYIDQPFVPKVMSAREKNTRYYKAALKTFLQHPRHGNPAKSCTTDNAGLSLAEEVDSGNAGFFGAADTCLEDLETFGVGISAVRRKFGRRCQAGDAESNEPKVKVRSLKVEPPVDDGDNDVRMSEMVDGRGGEADSKVLQVDKQLHSCPVIDSSARKTTLAATADKTTGVPVVDRSDNMNEDVLNSSYCDSDDALVIDVSANFESEDGDVSGVNSLSCATRSGVTGQTNEGSASDGDVEMLHGFSELKNETEGNSESAKEVVDSETKVSVQIETKVEVNESAKEDENSVCSKVKDNIDELKGGVELDEIENARITTRSLRRALVEKVTQSDDDVSDATNGVSNTRRQSLRSRTRASDDAPSLNVVTSTVATPVRRSLRSAGKAPSVDESDTGKKPERIQTGRRSDTTRIKKECEKDDNERVEPCSRSKRGRTQRSVTDALTDVDAGHTPLTKQASACEDGGASTEKRRSIRLIARSLKISDDVDVSNTGSVTTGTRKRRSEQLGTRRSVEVTSKISGPETTPMLKVELPSEGPAIEKRTACNDAGFQNVKEESSLATSSGETDVVMTKSKKAATSRVTGDNGTDDSGNCVARSEVSGKETNFIDVSKNSSNAASGSASIVIDENLSDKVVGKASMTNLVTCESTHLSEVNRAMHTNDMQRCSRSIDGDIDNTQNTTIEETTHDHGTGSISAEVGSGMGHKKRDATCVDNASTGSMWGRGEAQKRSRTTAVNDTGYSRGQTTDSIQTPLDKILLAQQKLLEPRYPSRQQSSTVPSTGTTAQLPSTVPSGDQTVKVSCEQAAANEWEMSEDAASYSDEAPSRSDLSYDLWTLGDIRVLVRSRCHGNITPYRKQTYHVEMAPKLEYQPIFGMEQVTPSEAARNWTSLRLHNKCRLVRVRINSFTSEIMLLEDVDIAQVTPPRSAFQPSSALTVLHRIMTKLLSLSGGQYLLSHTPSSGHANLKKSTQNDIGAYDLHLAHAGSPGMSGNDRLSWIPIDTSLKLPYHKNCFRIPATFEPKDATGSKSQPKAKQKRKRRKRKAGKKN